jgi:hypothetical protein
MWMKQLKKDPVRKKIMQTKDALVENAIIDWLKHAGISGGCTPGPGIANDRCIICNKYCQIMLLFG